MPFGRKKSLMDRAHDYVEQLSQVGFVVDDQNPG